jgi:hypothetical protein
VSIVRSVILHLQYSGEAMRINDIYNCYHKTYSCAQHTCKQTIQCLDSTAIINLNNQCGKCY